MTDEPSKVFRGRVLRRRIKPTNPWPRLRTQSDREAARRQTQAAIERFLRGGGVVRVIRSESRQDAELRLKLLAAKMFAPPKIGKRRGRPRKVA